MLQIFYHESGREMQAILYIYPAQGLADLAYKYFIATKRVHFCYCKSEDVQEPACMLC